MNYYGLGIIAGIVLAVVIIAIVYAVKGKDARDSYDERQLIARGKAYQYAFFTLMIYCAVCLVLDAFELRWALTSVQMYIGIVLAASVFAVSCVVKGAYNGIKGVSKSWTILVFAVGVLNLVIFIMSLIRGSILTDGILNDKTMQGLIGVMFLSIGIAQLIRSRLDKKDEDE